MTAADSYLLLRALVDEFARCGVEHAVASPGSRNTPIVLTLAREPHLRTWSQIDERSAGFFALGLAKSTETPVIITCTSGTAAANLLPAVLEAREARVPLIVLTADRPPELREIAAGQTIDQTKLYGDGVKWFFDLGVPEASAERLHWTRALACRAYWTASQGTAGPVHLNLPLREPLVLDEPLSETEPGGGGRAARRPWVSQPRHRAAPPAIPQRGRPHRAVWIAGDLGPDPALGRRLSRLAAAAQIPLLADPLSTARSGPSAVAHFDLLLRDPETAARLRPDVVVRFGDLPTSKPLRSWLAGLSDIDQVLLARDDYWTDPTSQLAHRSIGSFDEMLARIEHEPPPPDDSDWLATWTEADSAVAHAISEPLMAAGLSEPTVATALGQFLPADAVLFVGASMPIRDVEEFFPALRDPPQVMANRGANGIDGTVSTALGVAAASPGPVVLLLGDVTLTHDIGGLMAASRSGLKLTIVLLNNDGGGIFNFLPVATQSDVFEEYVATPPGLDFAQAAGLAHFGHRLVHDFDGFAEALYDALASDRSQLIEVRTDRAANRRLHAAVEAAAVAALGADQRPD